MASLRAPLVCPGSPLWWSLSKDNLKDEPNSYTNTLCAKPYPVLALTALLLSACAATPPTQFYLLEAQSKPTAPITPASPKQIIGLGPITLPAVLERKQIVTRSTLNQVQIAEMQQWAAPLKQTIPETLGQNLARLLPSDVIRVYPWNAYNDVQYRLLINILRFDTTSEKTANLEANWSIMDEQNRKIVTSGQTQLKNNLTGPSYPETVNALSNLLDKFSQELALVLLGIK